MSHRTIILENNTAGDITIVDLSSIVVPASGQIDLTDLFTLYEVQKSPELENHIQNGNILINTGSETLTGEVSQNYLTPMAVVSTQDPNLDIEENTAARHNQIHSVGGSDHTASTLANINTKISDLIATYGGVRDVGVGTLAQRPAAGVLNRFFWTTDQLRFYRDNGATWEAVTVATNSNNAITLPFAGETSSGVISTHMTSTQKNTDAWVPLVVFPIRGTTLGTPSAIIVQISTEGFTTATFDMRLVRLDTSAVICSQTGLSGISYDIVTFPNGVNLNMGTLSNLPTGFTNLQFQVQVNSAQDRNFNIYYLTVQF